MFFPYSPLTSVYSVSFSDVALSSETGGPLDSIYIYIYILTAVPVTNAVVPFKSFPWTNFTQPIFHPNESPNQSSILKYFTHS